MPQGTDDLAADYYNGFSNDVLWPLLRKKMQLLGEMKFGNGI